MKTTYDLHKVQPHSWFRLLGIVALMSRMPTFRRRFRNLVKVLYIEGLQASASAKESNNIDEP